MKFITVKYFKYTFKPRTLGTTFWLSKKKPWVLNFRIQAVNFHTADNNIRSKRYKTRRYSCSGFSFLVYHETQSMTVHQSLFVSA